VKNNRPGNRKSQGANLILFRYNQLRLPGGELFESLRVVEALPVLDMDYLPVYQLVTVTSTGLLVYLLLLLYMDSSDKRWPINSMGHLEAGVKSGKTVELLTCYRPASVTTD